MGEEFGDGPICGAAAELVTLGEALGSLASMEYGPLGHSGTMRLRTAGAEANVAIGASRLGISSLWAGRVGVDPIGDLIVRELNAEQVRVSATRDDAPTGLMIKEWRTTEIARIHYWRKDSAGSRLCEEDVPEDAIRAGRIVHLTGVTAALGESPLRALWHAIEVARCHGVRVSFDVNFRSRLWSTDSARPVLRDLAKHSDILFAGVEEAELLTTAQGDGALQELNDLGPETVLLKRGAQGSRALVAGEVLDCPSHSVRVVDEVGAGDAYAAGYLAGLLHGWSPQRRLDTATRLGSIAVSTQGDWEGLPHLDELITFDHQIAVQR